MRIKSKLTWLLLGVGIPTILVASGLGYLENERVLKDGVSRQLSGLGESKRRHLEFYIRSTRQSVENLGQDPGVGQAFLDLRQGFEATPSASRVDLTLRHLKESGLSESLLSADPIGRRLQEAYIGQNRYPSGEFRKMSDAGDGTPYSAAHFRRHSLMLREQSKLGASDLLLIDLRQKRVIYSTEKNLDFGARLDGPLAESSLGEALKEAGRGQVAIVDFAPYAPNGEAPASFIAAPIRVGGQVEGVLAMRLSISQLDQIVSGDANWAAEGLGETGETLLIGSDGLMRSDSRFLLTRKSEYFTELQNAGVPQDVIDRISRSQTTVLALPVSDVLTRAASQAEQGVVVVSGSRGKRVMASISPVVLPGLRWSIVSKIDVDEAMAPLAKQRQTTLITALCLIIAMVGAAWLAANHFVSPIKRLADAARRFGQGESGVRTGLTSSDEIGELGKAFDAMVEEAEHLDEIAHSLRRNIVHDLKTPLTVVKGMAETLRLPDVAEDPATRAEMVDAIIEQSDRLLDDLRDILVPVDIHYRPEPEEFDLSLVVERAARNEQHTKRAETHEIIVRGTDSPVPVFADSRKIRRVLENLISNAVKYSPGEGKRVIVELVVEPEMVEVHVQDEGMGLTAEQLNQVLGEGGRALGQELIGIEGTGIGLGSVQLILEAHGGELRALSQPGVGSRFTAIFPRRIAEASDRAMA